MGWGGAIVGGYLGSMFLGPLGAILGAVVGSKVEKKLTREAMKRDARAGNASAYSDLSGAQRARIFRATAAAMFAKIAKADGKVTRTEIAAIERAFGRLGFDAAARNEAVRVFRLAKDDRHTITEYAADFAAAVDSLEIRELLYEILWDIAGADGGYHPAEVAMLRHLTTALRIRSGWYVFFANERLGGARRAAAQRADPLKGAYTVLGASPSDSLEEVRRKYRELAKKNHPDMLRAQGLPDELIDKATARMSRINEAWEQIKSAREQA